MILKFLIWLDVLVFQIITLGDAKPGETISAAAYSLQLDGKWQGKLFVPLIDALFVLWQNDHCRKAYQWQIHLYQGTKP